MDSESQVIHDQMEETRTSLQDKLESLEQHVTASVHSATDAVTDTVDSVKEAVRDTVDSVKDTLDVRQQVERHPWAMFLGAALVGFVGARLLDRVLAPRSPAPAPPPVPAPASAVSRNGHSTAANVAVPFAATRTLWDVVSDEYSEELAKVKGLAISTAGGVLREMLTASASPQLAEHIKELVNGVTVKLGGHPLEGALWSASPRHLEREGKTKGASRMDLARMEDDGCPHSGPEAETDVARPDGKGERLLGAV
jgi:ElaB/YqjD/DUF883 family membrane-anchored ribosome-binding protein